MYFQLISCLTLTFVGKGFTKLIPDIVHPCKLDNMACLKQSAKDAIPELVKGLPEFGIPPMDPFHIDKISVPLPGEFKISFNNCKVTGIKKAVINNIEFNLRRQKLIVDYYANLTLKGAYEASGKLIALPINGKGDGKIKLYNFNTKITINYKIIPNAYGIKHLNFRSYKFDFTFGDKGLYNFTNLVKGNAELSNTVLAVINQNWRLVSEEWGKPILEYYTELVVKEFEKVFLSVPITELIDGSYD